MANRNVSQKTSSISNDNQKSGAFKKLMMTSALTAAGFIGIVGIAEAGTSTPTDGTTVYGSSTTTKSGDTYTTNQDTNIAISEYQYSLLLDGHETWNINQPGAGSLSAHRILTMDADPSRILGILNSNGRVLIIDPNGVFFGPGSRVDVAGIITTTGDIDNAQIIGNEFGDYTINNIDSGTINLQGQISVSEAGLAAFVAPTVKNAGIIKAKMGKIVMASGEKVTLDLYGDNLVEIEVAGGAEALVENTGEILAEGGEIHMTAAAAKQAVDNIINVDGIVSASSATMKGGKIVLGGGDSGTVKVAGKVDVSGEGAGKVEVKGQNITVTETAELTADGGENGDGGEVVIIADDKAIFRGKASAKGGTSNGKGGFVETSGLGYIDITGGEVDTRAADGTAGTWLIDPTDITILGHGGTDPIVISGDTSTIYWTQIAQALASNNVIISTAGSGSGLGDITFAESASVVGHSGTENRTLDFVADNNIIVNGNIVLENIGTTTLDALGDVVFNKSFITSDDIMSPATSGNLNVIADNDIFVNTDAVVGATIGNANVTLTAGNANGGNSAIEIDGMVRADMGKITLNADNYFVEVNSTGTIFSNGDLEVNSNHGFDVDQNGLINLHTGDAYINAPIVQLGADINTTGTITGTATTVKVENTDAEIQDGIDVAASGATVTVADGTYVENVVIDKSLSLLSENGRGSTTIQGVSGVGALGTVKFAANTSGVQLGDAGQGFTIVGIDNGSAGIENAAVYLQGAQSGHLIKGNDIVANGDAGLLSEYGATVSNITIDGNIFSGQTFQGANPAGNGFGSQFTLNNVPRQLVTTGGGTGGGNTSNITFSNNEITGTAGGLNTSGQEQGNTLVTIDADNSEITGNTFAGTTARYGTSLRARGDGTLISGNTFNAAGLTDSTGHLYVTNNVYTGIAGQDNIIDIWNSNTFVGRATVSSDDINASADGIGVTVGGAVAASNAGATVFINEATYNEGDINIDKNLLISGAGKGKIVIDATGFSNGFIINSDLGNTNTTIRRLSVNNATDAGIEVTNSGALKVLSLNQTSFANNGNNGVAVYGTGVKATNILNSDFLDNGNNNSGNLGRGDVLFYGYNGDITMTNVTIEGNTDDFDYGGWKGVAPRASYGVQVYGTGTDASGEINLDNVKISGNYRAALLGIQKYDGVDITLNDVVLGGQTSDGTDSAVTFGSLYLSELNDTVDIGNTSFLAIDDNTPGVAGQYIAVGVEAGSPTVIATNASFEGVVGNTATLAQSFAIEDKVEHDMDRNDLGFTGHVIWQNANEYFVTENNLGIQRAVDLASTGGLINVNSGTYAENVNINKDGLSILGSQSGVDARTRYGTTESIIEGYIKTGTIDGLTIDGFRIENQGDDVAGYGGKGSINLGNNASNVTIKNTIIDGNGQVGHGIVTSSAGASDIRIEKNLFTDNSYGVYVNSNDDNVVIVSNRFDGNRYGVITQDGGANTKVNGNTFINNTRAGVLAWSANGIPSTIGTMNNNQFRNNEQHIGHWDGNGADISIEADTGNKFYVNGAYKLVSEMTTEELFDLEDAITHVMDDAGYGRVVFGGNDLFVTSNTLGIQYAIDLANAGATVNVDGSTYTEDLVIDKALKLTGHGTTLQSAGGASLITVTAADVNIDPFAFVGDGATTLYGINATGANNLIVDGNSFTGFVNASINVANSNDVKIFGNTITGGQKGINGDAISNAQIHTNTINGTTVAGIHVANSGGTGYDGAGKDVDIWSNAITSADGRGILIQNSDFVTIGADALNPFASGYAGGNIISGGIRGIEVGGTDNAQIIFNTIDNTSNLGIFINNNNDTIVSNNKVGTTGGVDNIGANGIGAYDSMGTLIDNNIVTQTRGAGIAVHFASSGSVISNNDIDDIDREGIYVDSDNVTIDNNDIDTTGLHAVVVATSNGSKVINNNIGTTGGADNIGQSGIAIFGSAGTLVDNNTVTQTTGPGIIVTGASAGITVSNNDIDDVNREGIYTTTAGIIIDTNTIDKTGLDGISLNGSTGSQVLNNKIGTSGGPLNIKGDGIYAINSDDIVITGNKVERTDSTTSNKGNGIKVVSSDNAVIGGAGANQNIVNNVKWDGISVVGGDNVTIDNNKVTKAQRAGIYAENLTNSAITNNTIDQTTQFRGIGLNGGNLVTVSGNTIDNTALDGIYSRNVQNVTIASNLIGTVGGNIGANGILVDAANATTTNVISNTIANVADHGIAFTGGVNGGVVDVARNTVNSTKDGVNFDGDINNGAAVNVRANSITGNQSGVNIGDSISGARVRIVSNDIEGRNDGIRLDGNVRDNGILAINKNTSINGRFDDGVDVGGAANGGVIRIAQNDSITGRGNGIEANGTFDGGTLNINSNGYIYGLVDGVHVEGVLTGDSKIIVKDNTDIQSGFGDGVEIRDTGLSSFGADVRVTGNTISDVGSHGVNLYRVSGATVSGNTVSEAGRDGIHVERSWFTTIHGNQISRVLGDGIDLANSNFASIRRNIILLAAGNGILLNDSEASVIARNLVALVGDDGIDVEDSSFTRIVQNFIGLTGDDGIEVENSHFVDVKRNLIALVRDDGIDVDNSYGANIERNIIFLAGDNGIEVESSNNADILNNRIGLVGGNGIYVDASDNAEINRNRIQFVRENGIAVYGGSNNSATNNRVRNIGSNGIAFFGNNGFDISGNRVRNAYNGINVVASNDGTIEGNVSNRNRNNGINVEGSNTFTISGNTANRNDVGLGIYGSSNGLVDANTFNNNRDYGIHLGGGFGPKGPPTTTATILPAAIRLPLAPTGVSDITITNNTISNNRDIGLFAEGENHGLITLAGNDFIDNPVGARFESGAIDLSDVTNPNNFINTNPLALPIGMQFDGSPEQLTIVGETIGATTFDGFLNAGSFYVRFEDGSILDPVSGAPIVINGVGATYDGFNPAVTGGALTQVVLDFLEARIYDADDAVLNGRGQLFVGFVPDAATLENIEDFFNTFGAFNGGGNGASVTIAGLPFINAPNNPGAGTPNANFFANLEPAAGGESTDPSDLANLEPAAGGEESETSCWSDAANAASNGQVASFSFGGSFENSIAQASAGCQSASAQ